MVYCYHPDGSFLPAYPEQLLSIHLRADELFIEIIGAPFVSIYNTAGQKLFSEQILTDISGIYTASIPVTDLSPGVYFIEVKGEERWVKAFVKQ
ncbi:MAG: T9SS type A sorting domain-containing protein [Chitinophagales bacterium]